MPVSFKAPLSSNDVNNIFLDKTIDDTTIGKITMNNGNSTLIDDPQNYINELADVDGVLSEGDATAKDYSSNNFINDGDNRKVAIGKLDAQVKVNRDDIDSNDTDISALDGRVTTIEGDYGQPNGLATLDGTGKLPASQLTVSAMEFKGNWDANTNTPTLVDGVGNDGDTYRVNVAGTQDLGSGSISFDIGDWIYYSGLVWFKGDNVDQVISVNSQQGAVVLDADDIAETTRFWDIKHNNNAVVDPTVNEDSGDGYTVGSTWFNSLLGKKFTLQDATIGAAVWIETSGGGTGDGSFNYITNGNAETDTTGWTVYANTTPGTSPDDFGGTPNVGFTWTRNTTTPLIFTGDFKLTKPSGVNTQGHGAYFEFTSENGHAATMMLNSLLANTSAFDDNDLSIWLVGSNDNFVSNFTLISAANPDVLAGIPTIYKQFQLDAEQGIKYRYCIHNNVTDTTLKEAYFDEIKLGPSPVATSAVVIDNKELSDVSAGTFITATSSNPTYGTLNVNTASRSQVGNKLKLSWTFNSTTAGTTGSGVYLINLPDGLRIDTNFAKLPSTLPTASTLGQGGTVIGHGFISNTIAGDSNYAYQMELKPYSETEIFAVLGSTNTSAISGGQYPWSSATPTSFSTLGVLQISVDIEVPILGWSSNAVSSVDLGNREVVVEYAGISAVAGAAIPYTVKFLNKIQDTTASYNPGTGEYTIKESGKYDLSVMTAYSYTGTAITISLYVNGVLKKYGNVNAGNDFNKMFINALGLDLIKDDIVRFDIEGWSGVGTITNVGTADSEHYFSIAKRASPQTMLEAPTVVFSATSDSGQSINSDVLVYEDVVTDSMGSYNPSTGEYTLSVSGIFDIYASLLTYGTTWNNNEYQSITLRVNGTNVKSNDKYGNGAVINLSVDVKKTMPLNKGDVITVFGSSSDASSTMFTSGIYNEFSIVRIN